MKTTTLDGIGPHALADLGHVDITTARRWKRRGIPRAVARLAHLVMDGDLGELSRTWCGWKIRGEELISPEGYRIPMPWVRALPLTREALHMYRLDSARSREERALAHQVVRQHRTVLEALQAVQAAAGGLQLALAGQQSVNPPVRLVR